MHIMQIVGFGATLLAIGSSPLRASSKRSLPSQKPVISRILTAEGHYPTTHAQVGKFLLIWQDKRCVALRITEHPQDNPKQARYEWFAQNDGSMDFKKANVLHGTGEVHEREAWPDGSQNTVIKADSFRLEWSANSLLADWIYFPLLNLDSLIKMAPTSWARLPDVNAHSPSLRWLTGGNLVNWGPENAGLKLGVAEHFGQKKRLGSLNSWHLLVRNVSPNPIAVRYYDPATLSAQLIVKGSHGKPIYAGLPPISIQVDEKTKSLKTGETFELCEFRLWLGLPTENHSRLDRSLDAPADLYNIAFTYGLQSDKMDCILKSNEMPLNILPSREVQ